MKMQIAVVGSKQEVLGYRLAGIKRAWDIGDENLLGKLSKEQSIIFATKKAMKTISPIMSSIHKDSIVFEIPSHELPYELVGEIIRDTIGFDLRK